MLSGMQASTRDEIVEFNRREFFARVQELQPQSVLDVGCGSGDLLQRCRAAGIEATGVEPGEHDASAELHIRVSPAEQLPFEDAAFDWVTMRFVPHHLSEPQLAFAEAMRVCRSGFLVAEPWFDTSLASQRTSLELDRWVKRQHRRGGMVHEEVLDTERILAALPAGGLVEFEIQVDTALRLRARTREDVELETAPLLATLPPDHSDRATLNELNEVIARDGISWNGSLFVTVRRVSAGE